MAQKSNVNFKMNLDANDVLAKLKTVAQSLKAISDAGANKHLTRKGAFAAIDASLAQVNASLEEFQKKMNNSVGASDSTLSKFGQRMKGAFSSEPILKLKNNYENMVNSIANGTRRVAVALGTFRNVLSQSIDSVRQITQGFLSMGRALTFFVAIPVTAFLKAAIDEARDFETQMFRIMKVLSDSEVEGDSSPLVTRPDGRTDYSDRYKEVSGFIREIASVSGSSQQQFAKWTEELAQFGVESTSALKSFLPIMEMFSQSTDVSADSVVTALGSIANAFGYSMATGGKEVEDFVWRMANTINELENVTGANAQQIITALQDAGPTLSLLEVPPEVIASWAALGIEAGLSANEVGTGLRNLGSFMSRNYEKMFVKGGALEAQFKSVEGLRQAMADDFAGVFNQLVTAYADEEDRVKAIGELYQFLGMRAGRLGTALAAQAQMVSESQSRMQAVMQMSSAEWKAATSLGEEYADMQGSLSFQSQKLRNNISNLALTVGDTLIPILTRIVQVSTPIVKSITNIFGSMSEGTKRTLFYLSAMVAIGGPVLFFFSQMAFGASLIFSGLLKLGGALGGGAKMLAIFGGQLLRLNPIAWLFAGAISKASTMATEAVGSSVTTISDLLGGLADAMPTFGEGIFNAYAQGIENSKNVIVRAVTTIANVIASFFEAHSPPDTGPLQHIDKWGQTLFDTYLEGFKMADFGILSDVADIVNHVFQSWIDIGKLEDNGTAEAMLLQFREGFAQFVNIFNETGQIAEDLLNNLVGMLGEAGDEIKKLIVLNMQLKVIEEKIEAIEKRKASVTAHYRDQVRALMTSNLTLSQQADIIEQLQQERDDELAVLEEEQDVLEEQRDAKKEELAFQEKLLDTYRDQDQIFSQMLAAIEAMKDKLSGMGASAGEIDITPEIDLASMDKAGAALAEFGQSLFNLESQALSVEIVLRSIFKSFGLLFSEGIDADLSGVVEAVGAEIGVERFGKAAEYAFKYISNLDGSSKDLNKELTKMVKLFGKDTLITFFTGIRDGSLHVDETDVRLRGLVDAAGELNRTNLDAYISELRLVDDATADAFTGAQTSVEEVKNVYVALADSIDPIIKKTQALFAGLAGGDAADADYQKLAEFGNMVRDVWLVLNEYVPRIMELIGKIGEHLLDLFNIDYTSEDPASIVAGVLSKVEDVLKIIEATPIELSLGLILAFNLLKGAIPTMLGTQIGNIISGSLKGVWSAISTLFKGAQLLAGAGVYGLAVGIPIFMGYLIYEGIRQQKTGETPEDWAMDEWRTAAAGLGGMLLPSPVLAVPEPDVVQDWASRTASIMRQQANNAISTLGGIAGYSNINIEPDVKVSVSESARTTIRTNISEQLASANDVLAMPLTVNPVVTLAKTNVTPEEVSQWAKVLNATPEEIMAGDVKLDPIGITAPDLSWIGLEDKISKLVAMFMTTFNSEISGEEMVFSPEAQEMLKSSIINTMINGFSGMTISASIMSTLVLKIAEAMLEATTTDTRITSKMQEIGKKLASFAAQAMGSDLFGSTDTNLAFNTLLTIVSTLSTASAGLGTGFTAASTALAAIMGLYSEENWNAFLASIQLLASQEAVGGLPYVFVVAKTKMEQLIEFLSGEVTTAINGVLELINQLMEGSFTVEVTVTHIYTAKPTGSAQTGGAIPANRTWRVGESGEELFSTPVAGHITSHSQLSNMQSQAAQSVQNSKKIELNVTGSPVTLEERDLVRMVRKMEVLYGD